MGLKVYKNGPQLPVFHNQSDIYTSKHQVIIIFGTQN